jgi:hypothetical protein
VDATQANAANAAILSSSSLLTEFSKLISDLKRSVGTANSGNTGRRGNGNQQRNASNAPARAAATSNSNPRIPNLNYCHTHGYFIGADHTSATCLKPADGHCRTATRANTMGGSEKGKEKAGL